MNCCLGKLMLDEEHWLYFQMASLCFPPWKPGDLHIHVILVPKDLAICLFWLSTGTHTIVYAHTHIHRRRIKMTIFLKPGMSFLCGGVTKPVRKTWVILVTFHNLRMYMFSRQVVKIAHWIRSW